MTHKNRKNAQNHFRPVQTPGDHTLSRSPRTGRSEHGNWDGVTDPDWPEIPDAEWEGFPDPDWPEIPDAEWEGLPDPAWLEIPDAEWVGIADPDWVAFPNSGWPEPIPRVGRTRVTETCDGRDPSEPADPDLLEHFQDLKLSDPLAVGEAPGADAAFLPDPDPSLPLDDE